MSLITALAVSIGALGGLATFLVLGPLASIHFQIWAMFVAWACFFAVGGHEAGLRTTIVCTVYGAILGWITLLLVTHIPLADTLGLPLWAGICVAVMVGILVLSANVPALSAIPACVYGYAVLVAYALLGTKLDTLTAGSLANPLVVAGLSLIAGALFGYVSEKLAGVLTNRSVARTA